MKFEYIPKTQANQKFSYYIDCQDKFYRFVDEFNIVSVQWAQPVTISASYFLRLLQEGSSARARGYGKGNNKGNDDYSLEMNAFYTPLLDHGTLWTLKNGNVICTAMPYGDEETINDIFQAMASQFMYPEAVRLQFLDDRFHFKATGDCMILIYWDSSKEICDFRCSDEDLRRRAVSHSGPGILRYQASNASFIRDRYVSEYAKRRAQGFCQLCGEIAPFIDRDGAPFLETHHVIWLADGGEDSIENTVALCPNCHRKMHALDLPEDVAKLQKMAANTEWP